MSENVAPVAGQVSADGQFRWDGGQWVPIPHGEMEPTPWTRPMQLATAGFFVLEAIVSLGVTALTVNHDSMLRAMQAQGSLPSGTDANTVVNVGLGFAYFFIGLFLVLELFVALGSYLRWRWIFWVALIVSGLGGIGAVTNLGNFTNPDRSYIPLWGIAVNEVFALGSLALFIWLLVGRIKFGTWAMKKPGA